MPPVTCRCTPPPWQTPGQETPPESHPKSLLRIGAALQHAVKQQPLSEALPVISHPRVGGQVTQVLQCAPVPPLLPCPVQTHGLAPAQHLQQGSVPLTRQSLLSWELGAGICHRVAWGWPSVGSMPHRAERCCVKLGWLHTHTATQAVTVLVGSQDLETAVLWQTIQSTALDVLNMQHQRRQSIADSSSGGFSTHRDGGLLREEAHTFLSDVLGGRQAHCLAGHGWRGRPGRRGCCLRLSCRGAPGALERVAPAWADR